MLYDTPESQLKREAREEKLAAVTVCLRGDLQAVNAFVGPSRDLGHDSVLARIYPMLSVLNVPVLGLLLPECLPFFIQFLFSPSYLVLKGQGINLAAQHLLPTSKSDSAVQIETLSQIEQCAQAMCSGFTTLYCQPGSPLRKLDPLFFYNITVSSCVIRPTTRVSTWARFPSIVLFKRSMDASLPWVRICATRQTLLFLSRSFRPELWQLWT